jgi:hypothetical protein
MQKKGDAQTQHQPQTKNGKKSKLNNTGFNSVEVVKMMNASKSTWITCVDDGRI